ncbi:oxidoreductase [Trichoderma sp. SZMC 28014]
MAPGKLLEGQVALPAHFDEYILRRFFAGYGEGIVNLFADEGCKVVIADINEANGQRVATDISNRSGLVAFVKMNVTSPRDWQAALDFAKATFGGLDILVNNAGWTYTMKDTLTVTEQEYDRVFDINVKGIFHSVNTVLPHFLAQGSGNIINIGSCITEDPTKGLTWYGASKGAVDMITRHLAKEYSSKGIRVNGISPSIGQTSLMPDFIGKDPDAASLASLAAPVPLNRLCTPLDVAKGSLYFATQYFNNFQTGIILRVDGGHYI